MRFWISSLAFLVFIDVSHADVSVMASIKPVHSLVAQVMEGVGVPGLIVDGTGSPHTYSLKPQQAAELERAQLVFWIGHELEAFLEKPVDSLGGEAKWVALIDAEGVQKLPPRTGTNFDPDYDDGDEAGHDHHAHGVDPHIWLDPENAEAMLKTIAARLSEVDAANASKYAANAQQAIARLETLSKQIELSAKSAQGKKFIVFHDAYQYFEKRFGVEASGAISINPENPPGAKAIADIRARVLSGKIQCVFNEPQFDNKIVNVILDGTGVTSATIDPIGAILQPGPDLYPTLLSNVSQSLTECLGR